MEQLPYSTLVPGEVAPCCVLSNLEHTSILYAGSGSRCGAGIAVG